MGVASATATRFPECRWRGVLRSKTNARKSRGQETIMKPVATLTVVPMSLWLFFAGCSGVQSRATAPLDPGLTVVVGPVNLETPLPKSKHLYSFSSEPSSEVEAVILAQLVDEVQTKAQRMLTQHLTQQKGLEVVPFEKTRRILGDLAPAGKPLTDEQIDLLAARTGAEVVVTGLIHDYGKARWQYWVTGWLTHVAVASTIVGVATGWNPAAIGAYLALDATTDFPLWYSGAEVFGWAFRPVRVHVEAVQLKNCRGVVWSEDELAVKVPGKMLAEYPPEQQSRKEIQLEANLDRVMADLAGTLGPNLTLQACQDDGSPLQISTFSIWSVFDLLF